MQEQQSFSILKQYRGTVVRPGLRRRISDAHSVRDLPVCAKLLRLTRLLQPELVHERMNLVTSRRTTHGEDTVGHKHYESFPPDLSGIMLTIPSVSSQK